MQSNEKFSSSEFQTFYIDEKKSAIKVYNPELNMSGSSPKIDASKIATHALHQSNGDDVLEFPNPNDFDFKYPDFNIEEATAKDIAAIQAHSSDIHNIIAKLPVLKIKLQSKKKALAIELSDVIAHALTPQQTSTLPQISINNNQLNLSRLVIRPNTFKFLEVLSEYYNIVLYTTMPKSLAKPIIDIIDVEGKIFIAYLYQDSCIQISNSFLTKDLRIVGELTQTVIVDSTIASYALQPSNGLLVKPFDGSEADNSLLPLMSFLIEMKDSPDVRVQIHDRLHRKY